MLWSRFLRWALGFFAIAAAAIYAFILIADPYQDVPFSPPIKRAPIVQNQRYSYPAVARDPAFDSAIIGTSTLRLLDPALFDGPLGTHFANLAMNSATAYEQSKMHALFARHHPGMKYLVLGIDDSWCKLKAERYTFRGFPEWLYDDNRWNDLLYLFNDKALENAVRMVQYARGSRPERYARNGFRDFTRELGPLRLDHVRRVVYGAEHAAAPPSWPHVEMTPARSHPEWTLPNLAHLPAILAATPATTRVLIVFPPFHAYYSTREEAVVRECKGRVLDMVGNAGQVEVVDYMLDSPLTRQDTNYWDPLHPVIGVATNMARELAALLAAGTPPPADYVHILKPPGPSP